MKIDLKTFFSTYRQHFKGPISQSQVDGLSALLSFLSQDPMLSDPRHASYMLATVKHETADTFHPIMECGPKSYFDKYEPGTKIGKTLGNLLPGDGYLYRGRGYVQITGRANYFKLGRLLTLQAQVKAAVEETVPLAPAAARSHVVDVPPPIDLIRDPDLALDPSISYRIMSLGMRLGLFTGRRLDHYIQDERCDYKGARATVNGQDRASLIAGYTSSFERILEASTIDTKRTPSP